MSIQNGCSLATVLIETESRNTSANSKQNMVVMASDSPSSRAIPLPCALAFPALSHRDAATPSPCCPPHFMTQERIMFSNPTPSKPRLSPAATMSEDTLSALALRLYLAACNPSSSCRFWVLDHLCSGSNLSQSFHFFWITDFWKLHVHVYDALY